MPRAGLRPTQDMVRSALFSMVAAHVPGARVLDLFAGTGAVGLEALSRGAPVVWWVEQQSAALAALQDNLRRLVGVASAGEFRVVRADAWRFLAGPPPPIPFDLVYADPPYADPRADGGGRPALDRLLELLEKNAGWLAADGMLVFELGVDELVAARAGWDQLKDKAYGRTRLLIYRRAASPEVAAGPGA